MNTKIRENILAPTGSVAAANQYLYNLDGELASLNDSLNVGDIVFYDPRNNKTVGAGVTPTTVPKLGIAVVTDVKGNGMPTRLKTVYSGSINAKLVNNFLVEPPSYGCNDIVDFSARCTNYGETYSIQIETTGEDEFDTHFHNHWDKREFSVNVKDFACDSCETGIDEVKLFCALADKINAHAIKRSAQETGMFMKRAMKKQSNNRKWTAYPLFANDAVFNMSYSSTDCADCTHITGINGITIGTNDPIEFGTATLIETESLTPVEKRDRVIALINKAFRDAGVYGSAVIDTQLVGSGSPCTDFKIRINSCETFTLQDAEGNDITPASSGSPFTAITTEGICKGCDDDGTTWTPTAGIRVVAAPQEISCDPCDLDRSYWFMRNIRITVPVDSNWKQYAMIYRQTAKPPQNLGIQWRKRILDAVNGGPGLSYDNWVIEKSGFYQVPRKGTAFTESFRGLECKKGYCSIIIEHDKETPASVIGSSIKAEGRSIILLDHTNTTLYNAVKAVLDPYFTALGFGAVNCATDVDTIEAFNYETGAVTTNPAYDVTSKGVN